MTATVRSFVYLFLLAAMWGSSYALLKVMVETLPPVTGTAVRVFLAGLLLIVILYAVGQRLPRGRVNWAWLFVIGATGSAVPFTLLAFAVERIPSASVAVLMGATPLFTSVMAHLTTRDDQLSVHKLIGIVLGLVGVAVLFGTEAVGGIARNIWGMAAALAGSFSYALTNVVARRIVGESPVSAGAASAFCALSVVVPWALIAESPGTTLLGGEGSLRSWLALLALAALSSALGNVIFFRLIVLSGPTFVSLNNYLNPLIGTFWGVVLLGELAQGQAFVALALILVGIAVANWTALRSLATRRATSV